MWLVRQLQQIDLVKSLFKFSRQVRRVLWTKAEGDNRAGISEKRMADVQLPDDRGVVERRKQRAAALKFAQQAFLVDVETELLPGVEIGPIDEERNLAQGWHDLRSLADEMPARAPSM
jgi:hypothetical protein